MPNEIEIVVTGRNDTKRSFAEVESSAEQTGKTAGERLGDRFSATLSSRIRAAADRLGRDAHTLGGIIGDGVSKGHDDRSRGVRGIGGRILAMLREAGDKVTGVAAGLGTKIGGMLGDGVSKALGGMPPQVQAAVGAVGISIAAVLTSTIAAAITAGLLTALSGGVIVAGLALVADSPQVTAAGKRLKERFMDRDTTDLEKALTDANKRVAAVKERLDYASSAKSKARYREELEEAKKAAAGAKKAIDDATKFNQRNVSLKDAAKPFVEPLTKALDAFSSRAPEIIKPFERMSASLAPLVEKLGRALGDMAVRMMPGIESAVEAAKPLLDTLSDKLPRLGAAVSGFFDEISQGSPSANKAFADIIELVARLIIVVGRVISNFTAMYGAIRSGALGARNAITSFAKHAVGQFGVVINAAAKAFSWMPGLGPKLSAAAAAFNRFAVRVNAALDGIKDEEVRVRVTMTGPGAKAIKSTQGFGARASGGIAGGWTMVGERGRELVQLPQGSRVVPNGTTEAMMASGGGGGPVEVIVRPAPGAERGLAAALLQVLRFEVRTTGRGSVTTLLEGRA